MVLYNAQLYGNQEFIQYIGYAVHIHHAMLRLYPVQWIYTLVHSMMIMKSVPFVIEHL